MIGEKLKRAREKANLSQEAVAEKLNTSRSNISKYENDNAEPNIQTIIGFCKIYKISADYLLGIEKPKENAGNSISINQGHNGQATVNINNK